MTWDCGGGFTLIKTNVMRVMGLIFYAEFGAEFLLFFVTHLRPYSNI